MRIRTADLHYQYLVRIRVKKYHRDRRIDTVPVQDLRGVFGIEQDKASIWGTLPHIKFYDLITNYLLDIMNVSCGVNFSLKSTGSSENPADIDVLSSPLPTFARHDISISSPMLSEPLKLMEGLKKLLIWLLGTLY
jgi:hypothetical protein